MPGRLLISLLMVIQLRSFGQASDIISVRKRNGRSIKSFYEGSPILFQTKDNQYLEGPVAMIRHDSIYVRMFTIERVPSGFGTFKSDTISTYLVGTWYKDIRRIRVYTRHGTIRARIGVLMMIGGAGYAALNLLNGSFFHLSITSNKNLRSLGIAAGLFGAGFLNNKFLPPKLFSTKRDKIVYVSLN